MFASRIIVLFNVLNRSIDIIQFLLKIVFFPLSHPQLLLLHLQIINFLRSPFIFIQRSINLDLPTCNPTRIFLINTLDIRISNRFSLRFLTLYLLSRVIVLLTHMIIEYLCQIYYHILLIHHPNLSVIDSIIISIL